MILARLFTKIYKEGGIILVDATGQKYICGNPRKEKPITVKLLKDNQFLTVLLFLILYSSFGPVFYNPSVLFIYLIFSTRKNRQ